MQSGIFKLRQALPALFGVQLGRAILTWVLVLQDQRSMAYFFIGAGFFLFTLFRNQRSYQWARLFFGIGLIFGGLQLVQETIFPIRLFTLHSDLFSYWLDGKTFVSQGLLLGFGVFFTFIFRSGLISAGLIGAISTLNSFTLVGTLSFLIGSTLASPLHVLYLTRFSHREVRRSTVAVLAVSLAVCLMGFVFAGPIIEYISEYMTLDTGFKSVAVIQTGISLVIVMLGLLFLGPVSKFSKKLLPDTESKEAYHMEVIGDPLTLSPSLALEQADYEVKKLLAMVQATFDQTGEVVSSRSSKEAEMKVEKYESITDSINKEMKVYLNHVTQLPLGLEEARGLHRHIRVTYELESLADGCYKIAKILAKLNESQIELEADLYREYEEQFESVKAYFESIFSAIVSDRGEALERLEPQRQTVRQKSDELLGDLLGYLSSQGTDKRQAVFLDELRTTTDKMGSHAKNILDAYI